MKLRRMMPRGLRPETLERRELLAADLGFAERPLDANAVLVAEAPSVSQKMHYFSGDQRIDIVVSDQFVAVQGDTNLFAQAPAGLDLEASFGDSIAVYRRPATIPVGPSLMSWIDSVSPESDRLPVFSQAGTRENPSTGFSVATDEVIVAINPDGLPRDGAGGRVSAGDYLDGLESVLQWRNLPGTSDQFVVTVDAVGAETIQLSTVLNEDPAFVWATPNLFQSWQKFSIPNDPLFGNQWHFNNTGQLGALAGHDVNLPEAWDINPGGSSSIVVGIVDDGVANDHEDITVWVNPGEIPGDGIDNDGNGWIDDINGWNFVSNNNNSSFTADGDNHGTATAGIATADGDNGIGVAGAAYNSTVISARIFEGANVASDANIAAALYYMAGRTADGLGTWSSADIVSNSWGGGPDSVAIRTALEYGTSVGGDAGTGVVYTFSAGNGGPVAFPAVYAATVPGIVVVGATGGGGELADYSSTGAVVDLVAPSNQDFNAGTLSIETTDLMGTNGYDPSNYTGTGDNGFGGTSASAPIVAGIGALALAELADQSIAVTPAELQLLMRANTRLIGDIDYGADGQDLGFGYGIIDAGSLLANIGKQEISVTSTSADLVDGVDGIDFGGVDVGAASTEFVRIRNQGTSPLAITSISIDSGPFAILSGGDPITLGMGETVVVEVDFLPTEGGFASGVLLVESDDADEGTFEVLLDGEGEVINISGILFEDREGNGLLDVGNATVGGQSVFLDLNDNGILDQGSVFETTTPVTIVDGATVNSPLTVSGVTSFSQIVVEIDISHTWLSDMIVELVAPDGSSIVLANRVGGLSDDFTGTIFDDNAAVPIAAGTAPFTGRFIPEEPLADLLGTDPNGVWNLRVEDLFSPDPGVINSWSIQIGDPEPSAVTAPDGSYAFRNVPDGTYELALETDPIWSQITPPGSVSVTIDPATPSAVVDFAIARDDVAYVFVFEDFDGDGSLGASESLLFDAQLFVDANGNNLLDPPSTDVFVDTDTVPIADFVTAVSPLTVSGVSGLVTDVNVEIDITHTFVADLLIELVSPDGTTIVLVPNVGGGGDNFVNTILDDEAAAGIATGTAPFTGSFRPSTPLSTFDGENPLGVWSLQVTDLAAGDTGSITGWTLTLATGEPIVEVADDGWVAYPIAGSVGLGLLPDQRYTPTAPPSGVLPLVPDGTPQTGLELGAQLKVPSIAGLAFEDRNGDGVPDDGETILPGVSVFIDDNGNAILDGQLSFENLTPETITGLAVTESDIVVSDAGTVADDLIVQVFVDYDGVGNLILELEGPNGTIIELVSGVGGFGSDFDGTVFDDSAAQGIGTGTAPFSGTFVPAEPLSTFNGLDANGTWTLRVSSLTGAGFGTLDSWNILLGSDETSVLTDVFGEYQFFDLPAGTYPIAVQAPQDWSPTDVSSISVELTTGTPNVADVDFGVARNDHAYLHSFDDIDGDGVVDPGELPIDSTMFVDVNANGVFDAPVSEDFSSSTVVTIADLTTVTSTIAVATTFPTLTGLTVDVDITHTFIGDVNLTLVSPDGTRVVLMGGNGGGGDNATGTTFDDAAATSIGAGTAPFTGSFRPLQPLSTFDGINPNGTWTLEVFDSFTGDVGTLNSWGMSIDSGEASFTTDEFGWAVHSLDAGSQTIGMIPISGREFTVPSTGLNDVTGDGTPKTNILFGVRATDPPSILAVYAGSTTWNASFRDAADGDGVGAGNGIGIELTPGQRIPNAGIDQLTIQFSEDVVGFDATSVRLLGLNTLNYDSGMTVSYDPVTFRGLIQLASPLVNDKVRLAVNDAVVDVDGNPLNGDADTGSSGGVFDLRFDVLVGDGNGNGTVSSGDFTIFTPASGASFGSLVYNILADWNSNGTVTSGDFVSFTANAGTSLPGGEPAAPDFGSGDSGSLRLFSDGADAFFTELGKGDSKGRGSRTR